MNLADLRQDYTRAGLHESDLDADPVAQFRTWFEQARAANLPEPNAMTLATASASGLPSARIVLLKAFDDRGFVFFTSYEGRKALEITANPRAALLFYWPELERQIRIEGVVSRTSAEESAGYFASRPRGSRLGAWTSHQSSVVEGREVLEDRMKALEEKYPGDDIPCPPFWGGYRVAPESLEFWQGRPSRLHDRLRYVREGTVWRVERLCP